MLDEVSLGAHYFEIGLMLRESMLINGLLFNSEIWYGVSKSDISELEEIDKLLLRKLLQAHSKTPIESFYLVVRNIQSSFLLFLFQSPNSKNARRFLFMIDSITFGSNNDDLKKKSLKIVLSHTQRG